RVRGRGAGAGGRAQPRRRRRAGGAAVPGDHRPPRPADPVGGHEADRRRGPGGGVGAVRRRQPRLQQHPVQVPPARRRLDAGAARVNGSLAAVTGGLAAGAALTHERYVGQALARREDDRVLRGEACYVDDIELPGMAHAAFARSPHAHARVTAVQVPDELPPGVLAFVTPADLEGRVKRYPKVAMEGMEVSDDQHPILPEGEVRYAGQPVAGVIAESRALAEDAAELIEVDYEPLDAVVDPPASEHAMVRFAHSSGDVDGAFARAEHVVSGHYGM